MNTVSIPAVNILHGSDSRAVHIEYQGGVWTGIRVVSRSRGTPTRLELSRVTGTVGDIKAETRLIQPTDKISVDSVIGGPAK